MATMKDSPAQHPPITSTGTPVVDGTGRRAEWTVRVEYVPRVNAARDAELVRRIVARWIARSMVARSGGGKA
jgi:hypothetical protein